MNLYNKRIMKKDVSFKTYIGVDDSQKASLKIEIDNLSEEWITEYFTIPASKLQKQLSDTFFRCLKNIGASEVINNEEI